MSLALPLQPGTVVASDFRVERALARGGMGSLYVVTQLSTGHERVLKVMHSRLVADARNRERFLQEARASARIESDHVVQVIAAGFDDQGIPWIVMELLRGEDLATAIARRGAFSPADALEVFRQLGHALGAAHASGLVHRDLKPENIFLSQARREGVPFTAKLLDFGIAKVLEESGDARNTGALGTPLWMAPEQAERGPLSPSSDVWALGLVAFTVLTGKCYWHAGNHEEVPIERVLREVFVDALEPASARAAAMGRAVPPGFDAWFARCVVRDPSQRFRSAAEAVASLVPVLMGPSPTAEVPVTAWSGGTPAPASPFSQHTQPPASPFSQSTPPPVSPFSQSTPPPVSPFSQSTPPPVSPFSQHTPPPVSPFDAGASTPPPEFLRTAHWAGATPAPQPFNLPSSPGRHSAPHSIPSQPGYGSPSQTPSPPRSDGSSTWVLVGGLGFLALCLIGGGVVLLLTPSPSPTPQAVDAGSAPQPPRAARDAGAPTAPPRLPQRPAVRVSTLGVGFEHSCSLEANGTVRCWGWNLFGQCGASPSPSAGITTVPGLTGAVELVSGYAHNCARLSDGTARCWGLNSSGQLGDGTVTRRSTPSRVAGLNGITQLAVGEGHSCALLVDQTVRCWGANGNGQLGDRRSLDRSRPVTVANLSGVVEIAAGNEHTCARLSDGTVRCWGASSFGEVGDGWTRVHYEPARVAGLTDAVALGLGPSRSCAVKRDGSVWCWGRNDSAQIGDGTRLSRSTYVRVPGLSGVSDVALAAFHACAIGNDGALRCWGDNESGRLGDGTQVARNPDAPAEPLRGVLEVCTTEAHTCARLADRSLRCWGGNGSGQLVGAPGAALFRPTRVP
ncbi:MAG: protein kinase [Polyangiales bacterium]